MVFRTYTTLARCLAALPEPVALSLANRVGDVLFSVRADQREMVTANLRRVLDAGQDDQALLDRWAHRSFRAYARYWVEGARLGRTSPAEVEARTFVQGIDYLADGVASGDGVIMALPHIGSWEFGGAFLATQNLPMTSVAERLEPPELFEFFVEQRAAMGLTIVPLDASSGGSVMATLRAGGLVGLLVRSGCGRKRYRGGVLRRDDDHARRAGHPGPSHRRPPGYRRGLQRAGPRSPGPGGAAPRHHPSGFAPCRRGPPHPGDRHPFRGVDPAGPRAVARLPAPLAVRSSWCGGMTRFESRSLSGDAEFELSGRTASTGRPPSAPSDAADLDPAPANGHVGATPPGGSARHGTGNLPPLVGPVFRSPSEHEFDVVAAVDAEGRFIFISASAERLLGYDITNAVGQDVFSLFDAQSLQSVPEPLRGPGSPPTTVGRSRDADGAGRRNHPRSRRGGVNHLADPIGGIVVNIRDVTARKQLEQRIREEDRRQTTVIDSLADGVMMVDAGGTVVRVNESFEVMFEAPRIRVVGRRLETMLAHGEAEGIVLVDADGNDVPVADHPVLAGLRHGRRAVGVVLGILREGRRPHVGPDQHPTHGRRRRRGHRRRGLVQRHHRAPARLPPSSGTTSSSSRFCWTPSRRASWPAMPTGRITVFNPAARRLHGLSEDSDPIGTIPADQGLLGADGSPHGCSGGSAAPGHVGRAAARRGDRPGLRGRATTARSA